MKKVWQKKAEILSSKIDQEIVLMSIEAGLYLSLDPVGSRIWEILAEEPASAEDITDRLIEEYDVDRMECLADVKAFIEDLAYRGLITEHTK
jgi:hypothetical protein